MVRKRKPGIVLFGLTAGVLLLGAVALSCRTRSVPIPEGVAKTKQQFVLAGKKVAVDLFTPVGQTSAPVAIVVHGFSRSRANMAGWGTLLAANGFVTAVPDLPYWANHPRNGQAIRELIELLNTRLDPRQARSDGRVALLGFSMGGLVTLLAAETNAAVRCWVGLDPVDASGKGAAVARELTIPCVVLRAEPGPWNAHGNARNMAAPLKGPLLSLVVSNASHCDPENPTDWRAEFACGKTDPDRRRQFETYALATVRAVLFEDWEALATLRSVTNNAAVKEVVARDLEGFYRSLP